MKYTVPKNINPLATTSYVSSIQTSQAAVSNTIQPQSVIIPATKTLSTKVTSTPPQKRIRYNERNEGREDD